MPAPDVYWFHESDDVTRGYISDDHSLTISHVTKEDAGLYICTASNNDGIDKIKVSSKECDGISQLALILLI